MKQLTKRLLAVLLCALMVLSAAACGEQQEETPGALTPTGAAVVEEPVSWTTTHNRVTVHDPSIEKDGDSYYIFGSHLAAAVTSDLCSWSYIANSNTGYSAGNALFETYSTVFAEPAGYVGTTEALWAPDVIYNETMGKYCMYMSLNGTTCLSCIALAVSDSIEGPYTYADTLVYSGFTASNFDKTDVGEILGVDSIDDTHYDYDGHSSNANYPNAIDATVFTDKDGNLLMVYGSMSGGIFLVELDETTGLIDRTVKYEKEGDDPYFGTRIAAGQRKTGEGPYIFYDEETDYYYLFLSYGYLNAHSGYQIRLFRSRDAFGPYVDAAGNDAVVPVGGSNAERGVKLFGDYDFDCLNNAYVSGGHNSAIKDDDGNYYLIYHTRFNNSGETHEVRVHKMVMNADGWLTALPYEYSGETIPASGYATEAVAGTYEFLAHGLSLSTADSEIILPKLLALNADGTVSGAATGSWKMLGTDALAEFTLDGVTYSGTFSRQLTEVTQTETMTFSAISNKNDVIWGSMIPISDGHIVNHDYSVLSTYTLPLEIKDSILLPTTGDFGSSIVWTSSNPDVLATDGTLNRPLSDMTVTLTADISSGGSATTLTKNIKIIGGLPSNTINEDGLVAHYLFEEGAELLDSSGNNYTLENFGVSFEEGAAVFDGNSYFKLPAAVGRSEIMTFCIKFSVDSTDSQNPLITFGDDNDYFFEFYVDTNGAVVGDAEAYDLYGTQKSGSITGTGSWQRFGFNNGGTDSIDGYEGGSIAALNGVRAWRGATYGGFLGMEIEGTENYIGRNLRGNAFLNGKIDEIIIYNYYIGETGLKTCFE